MIKKLKKLILLVKRSFKNIQNKSKILKHSQIKQISKCEEVLLKMKYSNKMKKQNYKSINKLTKVNCLIILKHKNLKNQL